MSDIDESQNPKRIGNLNGPWAMALKFLLATYPLLLMWAAWVSVETVVNREFRGRGDRFTMTDASNMRREIDAQFAAMPPKDWRDRYASMETELKANARALIRIETLLDLLRVDLEVARRTQQETRVKSQ